MTGTSGLTEKKTLGNSISTVGGEAIGESGAVDVTGALSGKITGALVSQTSGAPAGGISVKLRGNSTINSDAEPPSERAGPMRSSRPGASVSDLSSRPPSWSPRRG